MIRSGLFALFYFFAFTLFSHSSNIDSLLQVISLHESQNDEAGKTQVIIELARAYNAQHSKQWDTLSQNQSIRYYKQAISRFTDSGDSMLYAKLLFECGILVQMKRDYHELALPYFEKAAHIFEKSKDETALIQCYNAIGSGWVSLGDMDRALLYHRKARDLVKGLKDPDLLARQSISLGISFINMKEHEEAKWMFQEALEAATKIKNLELIAACHLYLGGNYIDNKEVTELELETGKKHLDEAYELYTKMGNEYAKTYVNVYYASYYCSKDDYPTALIHSQNYISYIKPRGELEPLSSAYFQRGIIFHSLQKWDSAAFYFSNTLNIAKKGGNKVIASQAYDKLYQLEKERRNYPEALGYHEQFVVYKDSIYNEKMQRIFGEESIKQNVEGEQKARKEAESEAKVLSKQNTFYLLIVCSLIIILLVGGYLYDQLRKTRKQLELQNVQLADLNATKDKFFSIIAHDIRSPISALEGVGEQMTYYLKKNDSQKLTRLSDRIENTAKRLNNLLDNLLSWALVQKGMIPYHPTPLAVKSAVQENLELYEEVAKLKNIRLINEVNEQIHVYADIRAVATIFRNLINNAIKFTPSGGEVKITTEKKLDKVYININDTGTGIAAEKLDELFGLNIHRKKGTAGEKGTGLGLILCKDLVSLNKGSIKVMSEFGKGSSFIVALPQMK